MPFSKTIITNVRRRAGFFSTLGVVFTILLCFCPVGLTQDPTASQPPTQDQPDVLRVYTQLVQTDVMVFDKQGRFVDGLKSDDFELRIDGKRKPVEFFERVTAGSTNEEIQLAAARGSSTRKEDEKKPAPLDRGRPIFFYVDDLHLDLASVAATRKLIAHFINNEMGQNDEAAIASASGQIGFLQQLTDSKVVLRAALDRLKHRPYTVRDMERPAMTEYQALLITQNDPDITSYFIEQTIRENPGMTQLSAAALVANRARVLLQQGSVVTRNTLTGLEGLVRSAVQLPGRKLVFFVSGGFLLDNRNSDSQYRLQRITSAAARSGVVIYSIDARGLVATTDDIANSSQPDLAGRLTRSRFGELSATQDAMNALAGDTGGKATFNTNRLEPSLGQALKRTSTYYLLAWKPDSQSGQSSKFRKIEVKVLNKPDLTIHVRRGFFDREPDPAKDDSAQNEKRARSADTTLTPEAQLQKLVRTTYPNRDLPVSLSLTYVSTPNKGPLLTSALQIPNEFLSFVPVNGKHSAKVMVTGTVFDSKGNQGGTFGNQLTVDSASAGNPGGVLTYGFPLYVGPGIYQVRVGMRDEHTGRAGTAHGWIEIPDIRAGAFALSSIWMGVRNAPEISNASATTAGPLNAVDFSVTRQFSPQGFLRFLLVIYNAAPSPEDGKPDVAIQIQVVRDGQPVVTTALKKVSVENVPDATRVPYAAEVSLSTLPAGRYLMNVVVVDRVGKKSATQQSRFEIE